MCLAADIGYVCVYGIGEDGLLVFFGGLVGCGLEANLIVALVVCFYDTLFDYLQRMNAQVVHADSEELIERANDKIVLKREANPFLWITCPQEYEVIACEERDPHFLEVYKTHRPNLVIMDSLHTDYLASRIDCTYRQIRLHDAPSTTEQS